MLLVVILWFPVDHLPTATTTMLDYCWSPT